MLFTGFVHRHARHIGCRTFLMVDHYNHLDRTLQDTSSASVLVASKFPGGGESLEEGVASKKQFNALLGFHGVLS